MRFFVASGRPASSLLQETGVIDIANKNSAGFSLLLEMAIQTQRRVSRVEHSLIDRAVWRMTHDTALAQCFVFINKGPTLRGVTFETGFVSAEKRQAAALERLLRIGCTGFDGLAGMWVMTITTAHLAFEHGMAMRQLELRAHIQVTLKTRFRRSSRINDRVRGAAALHVQTARPMTRFASHVRGLFCRCAALCLTAFSAALVYNFRFCSFQARVRSRAKIARDVFVTRRAFFRADKFRAGNGWRRKNGAIRLQVAARKQNDGQCNAPPDCPPDFFAPYRGPIELISNATQRRCYQKAQLTATHFFGQSSAAFFSWHFRRAIFGRRLAGEFLEHTIELRQRLKSDRERDFADAKIKVVQKCARFYKSPTRDVVDKIDARYFLELFAQMGRAHPQHLGNLRQ